MPRSQVVTAALSLAGLVLSATAASAAARAEEPGKALRAGIIGCDTSHAIAFTKILHAADAKPELAGVRVVAAFPGGSPDLPSSRDRVAEYTQQLKGMGVEIVDTIPALLAKVDVVLLESVDGRPHLEQARPVFEAKKPMFIDKPLAASLADAVAIAELGKQHNVPWFSSSSLRFSPGFLNFRNDPKTREQLGDTLGCVAWSPAPTDPTHPDLFWYGIHGVETLFTIMGPGCRSVARTHTGGADVVTGVWEGDRIGTFRGIRPPGKGDYGATVFGSKSIAPAGTFAGYEPLIVEIVKFFKTGRPPVSPEETLEVIAFMEAAEESKRQGGAVVKIEDVMNKARQQLTSR